MTRHDSPLSAFAAPLPGANIAHHESRRSPAR
jgi:hypothetical protein